MKSIQQLKESGNKNSSSVVVESALKTPSTVRDSLKSNDVNENEKESLIQQNSLLKELITKRHKEIEKLDNDIVKKKLDIDTYNEETIDKAKKRADEILSDANTKQAKVDGLLVQAKTLQFNAEAKDKELDTLIGKVEDRLKVVETSEASIKRNKQEILKQLGGIKENASKIDDLMDKLTVLFLSAVNYADAIGTVNEDFIEIISKNIVKADRMLSMVDEKNKLNKMREDENLIRSNELDTREKWLLDREKTINRAKKEVERSK